MYALLDWDGTLRYGATIYAWMDYLHDKGLLKTEFLKEKLRLIEAHRAGELTHDQVSGCANQNYLNGVKGMDTSTYQEHARQFWQMDPGPSIPSTAVVFEWMKRHQIEPVVISGSARYVLEPYFQKMGIKTAFTFREEWKDGVLTGRPAEDWGHSKTEAVNKCIELFGGLPVLGMGDSESDCPLLDRAKIKIVVGGQDKVMRHYDNALAIGRDEAGARTLKNYLDSVCFAQMEAGL